MAGKNPAKLAETGKGCSPRRAGTPPFEQKTILFQCFNASLPVARNWH